MKFVSIESVALLIVTVVLLTYYFIHQKWQVLKKLNIPHNPPSLRMFGNIGENTKDPDLLFKGQLNMKKKFGNIYGSYSGLNLEISICDSKILKHIFIKEFSSFPDRRKY